MRRACLPLLVTVFDKGHTSSRVMVQEPRVEKPIIVAGKDEAEVDNDFFLIPVKIADHEGPLTSDFSIENRLLPQGDW